MNKNISVGIRMQALASSKICWGSRLIESSESRLLQFPTGKQFSRKVLFNILTDRKISLKERRVKSMICQKLVGKEESMQKLKVKGAGKKYIKNY